MALSSVGNIEVLIYVTFTGKSYTTLANEGNIQRHTVNFKARISS
jgi:hypothetical protein